MKSRYTSKVVHLHTKLTAAEENLAARKYITVLTLVYKLRQFW